MVHACLQLQTCSVSVHPCRDASVSLARCRKDLEKLRVWGNLGVHFGCRLRETRYTVLHQVVKGPRFQNAWGQVSGVG